MKFFKLNKYNCSDEELLDRFRRSGQSDYFGELYGRYMPLIYGMCLKYLRDADKAEDATMQLFENLLPKVKIYEIKTFRTWIHTVARNHCLQILRADGKVINVEFNSQIMESDDSVHLFDEPTDESSLKQLEKCMEKLPEPQRIAIEQFFMNERSYAEIVDITGYELKSVKSFIQNGKRNLKICIEKHTWISEN